MNELSEASVWEALEAGRAYVAFDWIADPTGFVLRADRGDDTWPIGSEVPLAADLRLRAEAPLEGAFKLVRDGEVVLEQTTARDRRSRRQAGRLPRRGLADAGRRSPALDPLESDLRAGPVTRCDCARLALRVGADRHARLIRA